MFKFSNASKSQESWRIGNSFENMQTYLHTHMHTHLCILHNCMSCFALFCIVFFCCLHLKSTRQTDVTLDLNLMPSVQMKEEWKMGPTIAINKSGPFANGQNKKRMKTQNKTKRCKRPKELSDRPHPAQKTNWAIVFSQGDGRGRAVGSIGVRETTLYINIYTFCIYLRSFKILRKCAGFPPHTQNNCCSLD